MKQLLLLFATVLLSAVCFASNPCTTNTPCNMGNNVRYGWSASGFMFWNDNNSPIKLTYFAFWIDGDGESHSITKTIHINANSYTSEFTGYISDGSATLNGIQFVSN